MQRFLDFLDVSYPALAGPLKAAGGAQAAARGEANFRAAWKGLASVPEFARSQHAFIATTHYLPCAERLKASFGLDLAPRSHSLKDVVWSVAVQHGPGTRLFDDAFKGRTPATDTDGDLIEAIYAERSDVTKYFGGSTDDVRAAVAARFVQEGRLALAAV